MEGFYKSILALDETKISFVNEKLVFKEIVFEEIIPEPEPDPNCIDYWPLTTNSIGTANGITGTDNGITYGDGYSTFSQSSYIRMPSKWNVLNSSFTLSFFIYPTTFTGIQYGHNFIGMVNNAIDWDGFMMCTGEDGRSDSYCGIKAADRWTISDLGLGTYTINSWNNFTFVYNGTQGRLYKNGVLLKGPKNMATSLMNGLNIGKGSPNLKDGVIGRVRDVRIDKVAWDATKVLSYYNNPSFE